MKLSMILPVFLIGVSLSGKMDTGTNREKTASPPGPAPVQNERPGIPLTIPLRLR